MKLDELNKCYHNMDIIAKVSDIKYDGAMRLALRHLRNHNPDMWDGVGQMPKSFDRFDAVYRIDDGHQIRISSDVRFGEWMHIVEYVVCGEVSSQITGYGIDSPQNLADSINEIKMDYPEVWLERFEKDSQVMINILRPIPANRSIYYKYKSITLDMSSTAIAAYSIFSVSGEFPSLNNELADNEYFGGDNDFHIALMVNSTRASFPDMPASIVEWAKDYANGDTFDSYFDRIIGNMD